MGVGGATWDTAGTLDLGSGNAFDVTDTTDDPPFYDVAWWKFTPGTAGLLSIEDTGPDREERIYHGTEADRVQDFPLPGHGNAWLLSAGVEYHVQVSRDLLDEPPVSGTYEVSASFQTWATSAWIDDLQDDPQNYLIVTAGASRLANPNPAYSGAQFDRPEWMEQVVRAGQARRGDYTAQETLGGSDPIGAFECVMSHADMGEVGHQLWNTTTTDVEDHGPPVCRLLHVLPASAEESSGTVNTHYDLDYSAGGPLIAGQAEAVVSGPSWFLWHLPVRDNIGPLGVLDDPDPADYGFSADAVVEYEEDHADLGGIDLADGDPLDEGAAPFEHQWALNTRWAPSWDGVTSTAWWEGPIATAPPDPVPANRPHMLWDYKDGEIVWQPVENSEGWDGHDWTEGYDPDPTVGPETADGVVVAWPYVQDIVEFDDSRFARIAVKYRLQAQRFRFVYPRSNVSPLPNGGIPPRRIFGRSDGATHGARRALGGGNTRRAGSRTLGGIL